MAAKLSPKPIDMSLRVETNFILEGREFDSLGADARWTLRRLVEHVYTEGYATGHAAGRNEIADDVRQERERAEVE